MQNIFKIYCLLDCEDDEYIQHYIQIRIKEIEDNYTENVFPIPEKHFQSSEFDSVSSEFQEKRNICIRCGNSRQQKKLCRSCITYIVYSEKINFNTKSETFNLD